MEVELSELDIGGYISAHLHPFEESILLLDGSLTVHVGGSEHHLRSGDFGFTPVALDHSIVNSGSGSAEWITIRSPQPKAIGSRTGHYPVISDRSHSSGSGDTQTWASRLFGSVDWENVSRSGQIQMRGFRSPGSTNVGISLLVDEVIGARHHNAFLVRFDGTGAEMTLEGNHFHPFEEAYYFLRGEGTAHIEGEQLEVREGDLLHVGVNTFHGFTNSKSDPVFWLEFQSPAPPPSDAVFFRSAWEHWPGRGVD